MYGVVIGNDFYVVGVDALRVLYVRAMRQCLNIFYSMCNAMSWVGYIQRTVFVSSVTRFVVQAVAREERTTYSKKQRCMMKKSTIPSYIQS